MGFFMVNFLVFWFSLTFTFAVSPKQQIWSEKAEGILKKELDSVDAGLQNFGLWVKKGDEQVQINGDKLFVPASLSKIPTALAFLDQTSMDEKFKTWIYHTGKIKNGILKGDLYLKGGGDPTFVTESMWIMVNELKRSDIKSIDGQFYVDESYFDLDYYSKGRQTRRVDRAYDAPVSALSFNWNSLSIYVRPGVKRGDPARVYTDPELPNITIKNSAKTSSGSKTDLQVRRVLEDGNIVVNVSGKISLSKEEKAFYKSVGDAALFTGQTFAKMLNRAGISYTGDVKKGITPPKAIQLVEHEGWSVPRVMAALSKFSNNFVAEMLTKHLGKTDGQPGNIDDGLQRIVSYLGKKRWPASDFEFVNPSGFTRQNKMRADHLGALLEQARYDFDSAPEFMSSLPISGTDGTLKARMKQTMKGKVRAKTGYLSGVVALAGYMDRQSGGEPITFVFFYNGPSKQDWNVRAMFNRLLWRLYQKS